MAEEKGFESVQDKILRSFLHSVADDLYSAVLHRKSDQEHVLLDAVILCPLKFPMLQGILVRTEILQFIAVLCSRNIWLSFYLSTFKHYLPCLSRGPAF